MSPGENAGFMLPDRTVTGRYQPVRGRSPSPTNATTATTRAPHTNRSSERRSAAFAALLRMLDVPACIAGLLVGRGALCAGERVADRRRLVLQRVAGAAWQCQRHAQMVG